MPTIELDAMEGLGHLSETEDGSAFSWADGDFCTTGVVKPGGNAVGDEFRLAKKENRNGLRSITEAAVYAQLISVAEPTAHRS